MNNSSAINMHIQSKAILFRLYNDEAFKKELIKDPVSKLLEYGIEDPAHQAAFIDFLNSLNYLMQESIQKTMKLGDRFKGSVKTSLDQIEAGYRGSMIMYWIAFLTGVLLIIASLVFAFMKEKNLLSILFGSLGTLDLLTFFIMKPPLELQNSRIGFARLEAAFMNWFVDLNNLNSLYTPLQVASGLAPVQPGQVKMSTDELEFLFKKSMAISDQSINNTQKTLDMMGKIIREPMDKITDPSQIKE